MGLHVITIACMYICAGMCAQVSGGGTMKLRSSDPLYLAHVDRFWNQLLPRMTPLLYSNGGPIVMVQVGAPIIIRTFPSVSPLYE